MLRTLFRGIAQLLGVIAAVALLGACEQGPGTPGPRGPQGEPGPQGVPGASGATGVPNWADVLQATQLSDAVYAIGIRYPDGRYYVIGTGFSAYYTNVIWTAAHVALALRDELRALSPPRPRPFAAKSGTAIGGPGTYVPRGFNVHPGYDGTTGSPDVAILTVNAELTELAELLPRSSATELRVGQLVATFGFPGAIGEPYQTVPIAAFKDGTISALRPYSILDIPATPDNSTLVQLNLDLSAGTSGSPIIDHTGQVVAVNNAGTERLVFNVDTGRPERVPSGDAGFGIRVDEVWSFIDVLEAGSSAAGRRAVRIEEPSAARRLTAYHAFPESWNGES